jgi:hypothetical protein
MKHGFKKQDACAQRRSDNPLGGVAVQQPVRMFLIDFQHFPIRVSSVLIRG